MTEQTRASVVFWPILVIVAWITGSQVVDTGKDRQSNVSIAPSEAATASHASSATNVSNEQLFGRLDGPIRGFLGLEPNDRVNEEAFRARGVKVSFMLATLPDPIDTEASYYFDGALEAIQRGAGADEYVLDHFYLPWQEYALRTQQDAKSSIDAAARRYLTEPGILLFRQPKSPSHTNLLVVYVVGETPTAGVHKRAVGTALTHAAYLRPLTSTAKRPLMPILGPFFSGSADSLAAALRDWRERVTGEESSRWLFDVVSGTATGVDCSRFLNLAGTTTTFTTTTLHVSDMRKAIEKSVAQQQIVSAPCRIAWLVEGSGYGDAAKDKIQDLNDHVLRTEIRFPLHISRVRSIHGKAKAQEAQALPQTSASRVRSQLSFDGSEAGREQPLHVAPAVTTAAVEMILRQIIATVDRDGIQYIGIIATDARDRIFLASFIREQCPDAQLLIINSDLLYLHPDAAQSLSGSLVASPYPLFPDNQHWSFPKAGARWHLVFSSPLQTGCYNAVRVLLHPEFRKAILLSNTDELKLIEYGVPFDTDYGGSIKPPTWISLVGQNTLWPLHIDPSTSVENYTYQPNVKLSKAEPGAALEQNYSLRIARTSAPVIVGVLAFGATVACGLFWPADVPFWRPLDPLKRNPGTFDTGQSLLWISACTFPLAGLLLWLGQMTEIATRYNRPLESGLAILVQWAAYVISALLVAAWLFRVCRGRGTAHRLIALLASACAMLALSAIVASCPDRRLPDWAAAFRFLRNCGHSGEASLLRAALLLVLVIFAWGFCGLRRRYLEEFFGRVPRWLAKTPGSSSWEVPWSKLHDAARAWKSLIQAKYQLQLTWKTAVLLGATTLWCGFLWLRGLPTFEGPAATLLTSTGIGFCIWLLVYWVVDISRHLKVLESFLKRLVPFKLEAAFGRIRTPEDLGLERFLSSRRPRREELEEALVSRWNRLAASSRTLAAEQCITGHPEVSEIHPPIDPLDTTWIWTGLPQFREMLDNPAFTRLANSAPGIATLGTNMVSEMEDLIAVETRYFLQGMIGQLRNLITWALISAIVFFAAVAAYPFRPQRGLLLTAAFLAAAVTYLLIKTYVRLDRDPILSAIAGTDPNRVHIDWQLVYKVVPVALLFAGLVVSQFFPDAWYWLRSWIAPFLRTA
jgi:hypothetical protein